MKNRIRFKLCQSCKERLIRARNKIPAWIKKDRTREKLISIYGNKCMRCHNLNKDWNGFEKKMCIDHIKPLSLGGKNTFSNFQLLCSSCNSWKNMKTIDFRPTVNKTLDN